VLVSRIPSATSDRSVDDGVDVVAQGGGVDVGESCPSLAQLVERYRWAADGGQLGDGLAGAGDGQSFTPLGALDDLTTMIA